MLSLPSSLVRLKLHSIQAKPGSVIGFRVTYSSFLKTPMFNAQ